jgi:hypothetical protein
MSRQVAAALWLICVTAAPAQPAVEAWVQRYGHLAGFSEDFAQKLVVDNAGDVIVAGTTTDGISFDDFLTIKYSGAGIPLWTNRYDGPTNLFDQLVSLAVDRNDNVFVTGHSWDRHSQSHDYVTLAYSAVGVLLWTNRHNAWGYSDDQVTALAVAPNGNVFVAGSSGMVAYSGAGVPLWTNYYWALAIAVNGDGNLFVAGGSFGDYTTIAYTGAGMPLWTNRYNGPENYEEQPTAIVVNRSGNVFVTGESYQIGSSDWATVAYSGAGVPLWTNRYSGEGDGYERASALAVDASGNVFVTGWSIKGGSTYDYATIAYSNVGVPLWTNHYHGFGKIDNVARAVTVDNLGTVFVTGQSGNYGDFYDYVTVAYSGGGIPLWTNHHGELRRYPRGANAIAVDPGGNLFVSGNSYSGYDSDFATVAYSGTGVSLWTNHYNGPGNWDQEDRAIGIAVHQSSGNVFVTGFSYNAAALRDFATVAYSGDGTPLWTNRYNGPGNSDDQPAAIAVDHRGNVFVTGDSHDGRSFDYATVAYSRDGVPLWTNRYGGLGDDHATAVAVDACGKVFVTGESRIPGPPYDYDYLTVAYSGDGVPLWTNRYNRPLSFDDQARAIAVDRIGNVFVTGYSGYDGATIAYSGAGVPLWTNRYNGPESGIAVDVAGNVLVSGSATIAYSNGGVALWTNHHPSFALALGRTGNVFITGPSGTVACSGAGLPLWTNRYSGRANAITVDRSGNVFVTGSGGTVEYSGAGVPLRTNYYQGLPDTGTYGNAIAVDLGDNVFVTGASGNDFVTIKYSTGRPYLTVDRDDAGGYFLRFNGSAGSGYRLQRTTSLTGIWETIAMFTGLASQPAEHHDLKPPTEQAFYRVVTP